MKAAAIYAPVMHRVSTHQQRQDKTIISQTAAVMALASAQGYSVPAEWIFEDEGSAAPRWFARVWSACRSG